MNPKEKIMEVEKKYIQESLQTEIAGSYDVIVVGGGPSGATAGIAAARMGANVLLIEKMMFLGGMWTGGLVNPLFDHWNKKGILKELVEDQKKNGTWGGFDGICYSFEYMKTLLEDKFLEAGGHLLYGTQFVKAIEEDNRVTGVIVENKAGRRAYFGRVILDCSGDADVVASAGGKTFLGREGDQGLQPSTLMFTIGPVHYIQKTCDDLRVMIEEALKKDDAGYRLPYTRPYVIQIPGSSTAVVQLTHMKNHDPEDPWEIGKAMVEGRRQANEVVNFMKEYVPEFKGIELLQTAPLLGIREGRRIEGDYIIQVQDLLDGSHFEDDIACASFNADIHNPNDDGQTCFHVQPYGIPYRSLLPKGLEGILVAGKAISGTHEAMASYRVTGNCAAMGESAGIAAALAVKKGVSLREVSAKEIVSHIKD